MHTNDLTNITFYQKKRDILLMKASYHQFPCILKATPSSRKEMVQALHDEYDVLSTIDHPAVPRYYGIMDKVCLGETTQPHTILCMEHRPGTSLGQLAEQMPLSSIIDEVCRIGDVLKVLLDAGILYMDLHGDNILLHQQKDKTQITLLDYTCCYYYQHNPHPDYALRFSHRLDPLLKGQQLLIQELTFLIYELTESKKEASNELPSRLYTLLSSGSHPTETMSLGDFLDLLKECMI